MVVRVHANRVATLNSKDKKVGLSDQITAIEGVYAIIPTDANVAVGDLLGATLSMPDIEARPVNGLQITAQGLFAPMEAGAQIGTKDFVSDNDICLAFANRFGEVLTEIELGILKSLLSGDSLSAMSAQDGVSYGTRRNQLAVLRDKAGVKRQSELTTIMAVLLTSLSHKRDKLNVDAQVVLKDVFASSYAPAFRMHLPLLPSGRLMMVVDIGPLDGRPVVFAHSSFYPLLPLPNQVDLLERLNVRVLAPIRPGHFGAPSTQGSWQEVTEKTVEDFVGFLRLFSLTDAPIVGHATGSIVALQVAQFAPNPSRRLILSSPQYLYKDGGHPRGFNYAWSKLCSRYPQLIEPIIKNTVGTFLHPDYFISILRNAYRENGPDLDLIEAHQYQQWYRDLLRAIARHSTIGLGVDFALSGTNWIDLVDRENADFHFVYGAHDVFSRQKAVTPQLLAAGARVSVDPALAQDGNVFSAEHLLQLALDGQNALLAVR